MPPATQPYPCANHLHIGPLCVKACQQPERSTTSPRKLNHQTSGSVCADKSAYLTTVPWPRYRTDPHVSTHRAPRRARHKCPQVGPDRRGVTRGSQLRHRRPPAIFQAPRWFQCPYPICPVADVSKLRCDHWAFMVQAFKNELNLSILFKQNPPFKKSLQPPLSTVEPFLTAAVNRCEPFVNHCITS
jgi:hypothetical protein